MKPALYYSIRKSLFHTIIAVTSEKPGKGYRHDKWAGREVDTNTVTHGTVDDLRGRFATEQEAQEKRASILTIANMFDEARKVHYDAISALHRDETAQIAELLK